MPDPLDALQARIDALAGKFSTQWIADYARTITDPSERLAYVNAATLKGAYNAEAPNVDVGVGATERRLRALAGKITNAPRGATGDFSPTPAKPDEIPSFFSDPVGNIVGHLKAYGASAAVLALAVVLLILGLWTMIGSPGIPKIQTAMPSPRAA